MAGYATINQMVSWPFFGRQKLKAQRRAARGWGPLRSPLPQLINDINGGRGVAGGLADRGLGEQLTRGEIENFVDGHMNATVCSKLVWFISGFSFECKTDRSSELSVNCSQPTRDNTLHSLRVHKIMRLIFVCFQTFCIHFSQRL